MHSLDPTVEFMSAVSEDAWVHRGKQLFDRVQAGVWQDEGQEKEVWVNSISNLT